MAYLSLKGINKIYPNGFHAVHDFNLEVKNPANIKIKPRPTENKNSIIIDWTTFALIDAKPIMLANIGVEQGVPINANTIPKISGYKKSLLTEFWGISLIKTGSSKSITSRIFNPIIKIIEAIISAKYGFPTNILPVIAQIPPIIEKTIPVPITKIIICNRVRIGFASENPPI
mgnify:CR=1 FL=1